MEDIYDKVNRDPYGMLKGKLDERKKEAEYDNMDLIRMWNTAYQEMKEGLEENQRYDIKRASEKDKNKDKYGKLKFSIQKSIEKRYEVDRKVLEIINKNILSVISNSSLTSNAFDNIEMLCILRNLPSKYTKVIIDALSRDYSNREKKSNEIFKKLWVIADSKKSVSPVGNYNNKMLHKLCLMYKYYCSKETKTEFREYGDNTSYTTNIVNFLKQMVFNGKVLQEEKFFPQLIAPNHLEEDFIGKIDIVYTRELHQLIEYREICIDDKLKEDIDKYIELYERNYIYSRVATKISLMLSDKSFDEETLKNTINALRLLKEKLEKETKLYEKQLDIKLRLITAKIEKMEYIRAKAQVNRLNNSSSNEETSRRSK